MSEGLATARVCPGCVAAHAGSVMYADKHDDQCKAEHAEPTPRPWKWLPDEGQFIVAANDYIVAEIPCQGCNPADGEFIVKVVNAYESNQKQIEQLRAALKLTLAAMRKARDEWEGYAPDAGWCNAWDAARAALTPKEGE